MTITSVHLQPLWPSILRLWIVLLDKRYSCFPCLKQLVGDHLSVMTVCTLKAQYYNSVVEECQF